MMNKIITKEVFAEEFFYYISRDVEPIDAILTISQKYELTEDQVPRLLTEQILSLLSRDAQRLNFIKEKSKVEPTLDDFF